MTIEEKRAAIKAYCDARTCPEDDEKGLCPLWNLPDLSCYTSCTDESIENHYKILFGDSEPPKATAPERAKYWARICEMQKRQTEKGLAHYGQILEDNTRMTIEERLVYLEEELIDALMYVEHIKEALSDVSKVD